MSEEQRITKVDKEKDPRRVEAGKRLAAISRAAKEKKAERQRSQERMEQIVEEPTEDVCDEGYSTITILTGVGVLAGLVCLYFTYKQDKRATAKSEQQVAETPSSQTAPQKHPKPTGNKLRSLDD